MHKKTERNVAADETLNLGGLTQPRRTNSFIHEDHRPEQCFDHKGLQPNKLRDRNDAR
jgi:hypothetical protein